MAATVAFLRSKYERCLKTCNSREIEQPMSNHNERTINALRTDKIKLLRANPDEYFKHKLRIDFGTSEINSERFQQAITGGRNDLSSR